MGDEAAYQASVIDRYVRKRMVDGDLSYLIRMGFVQSFTRTWGADAPRIEYSLTIAGANVLERLHD